MQHFVLQYEDYSGKYCYSAVADLAASVREPPI